jgi:hypothetical protein
LPAAAVLTVPFLTGPDSRAEIKGSRDPLGVQPIWTRLGRHCVGKLTTVTRSVRDFNVLLIGVHFAQQVAEKRGPEHHLGTFLRWEQFAGYARSRSFGERNFRGRDRVGLNLADSARAWKWTLRLSALPKRCAHGDRARAAARDSGSGRPGGMPAEHRAHEDAPHARAERGVMDERLAS